MGPSVQMSLPVVLYARQMQVLPEQCKGNNSAKRFDSRDIVCTEPLQSNPGLMAACSLVVCQLRPVTTLRRIRNDCAVEDAQVPVEGVEDALQGYP